MQAWSEIVRLLVPNVTQIEARLKQFGTILDADEVLLLEKATFLVISHCQLNDSANSSPSKQALEVRVLDGFGYDNRNTRF